MSDTLPAKPAASEPCNGCGVCCAEELCQLANEFLPETAAPPCPALEIEGGRTWCGLVRDPGKYMGRDLSREMNAELGSLFGRMLGVGKGCCSDQIRGLRWAGR